MTAMRNEGSIARLAQNRAAETTFALLLPNRFTAETHSPSFGPPPTDRERKLQQESSAS